MYSQGNKKTKAYLESILEQAKPECSHPVFSQVTTPKFLAICHDQEIDRRIIHQMGALSENGWGGVVVSLSLDTNDKLTSIKVGERRILNHQIGLKRIIPDCPIYWRYQKRQSYLTSSPYLSKLNWFMYKLELRFHYKAKAIQYPLPFDLAFKHAASLYKSDLIFAHDLPALKTAVELSTKWDVPLIYDSHELYSEQKVFSNVQKKIMDDIEKKYIHACARVITVSDSFAHVIQKKNSLKFKPETILNVTIPELILDEQPESLRERIGAKEEEMIILYQGGVLRNRNLENLTRGYIQYGNYDSHLVFMGPKDPALAKRLRKIIDSSKMAGNIHFLDPVSQDELLHVTKTADFGVVPYEPVDLNSRYCMPNKLFEYMQASLPVLANESLVEVNKILTFIGGGGMAADFSSPESIALAFKEMEGRNLKNDREMLNSKKSNFSWEYEKGKFISIVNEVMSHEN